MRVIIFIKPISIWDLNLIVIYKTYLIWLQDKSQPYL